MLFAALAALAVSAIWLLPASVLQPYGSSPLPPWLDWNLAQFDWPKMQSLHYFLRYGIWFFWPAWPLAGWAVYAWRRQDQALHIALPLCFTAMLSWLAWLNPMQSEGQLLPLLPAIVILAAFGLPTMKRGAVNAIDWFAMMALSMCALFIWLFWIALHSGWPQQLAKNVTKLAPRHDPRYQLVGNHTRRASQHRLGWCSYTGACRVTQACSGVQWYSLPAA